jgi:hypothetical protein
MTKKTRAAPARPAARARSIFYLQYFDGTEPVNLSWPHASPQQEFFSKDMSSPTLRSGPPLVQSLCRRCDVILHAAFVATAGVCVRAPFEHDRSDAKR